MSLQTSLAKARGLGSAKSGTHHWWMQRLTAVALVPLSFWFIFALISLTRMEYTYIIGWIASPVSASLLILFVVTIFYHAILGLQVVIEDYLSSKILKITAIILTHFIFIFSGLAAVIAVLKIAFGI